jgi:CRP-like cAMP-binding protein
LRLQTSQALANISQEKAEERDILDSMQERLDQVRVIEACVDENNQVDDLSQNPQAIALVTSLTAERDSLATQADLLRSQLKQSQEKQEDTQKRADDLEMRLTALMKASASSAAAAAAVQRGVAPENVEEAPAAKGLLSTANRIAGWKATADATNAASTPDGDLVRQLHTAASPLSGKQDLALNAGMSQSQVSFLKSVPLFHSFTEEHFNRLVTKFHKVAFEAGDVILTQGDPPDGCFYVIVSGKVAVHVKSAATASALGLKSANAASSRLRGQSSQTVASDASISPRRVSASTRRLDVHSPPSTPEETGVSPTPRTRQASLRSTSPEGTASETSSPQSVADRQSAFLRRSESLDGVDLLEEDMASSDDEGAAKDYGPVVAQLSKGMFFGERALMTSEPRAATCIAAGHAVLYALDRKSFEEVLGSVSDFLGDYSKRNYLQETSETLSLSRHVSSFQQLAEHASLERLSWDDNNVSGMYSPTIACIWTGLTVSLAVASTPPARAIAEVLSLMAPEISITEVIAQTSKLLKSFLNAEYVEIFLVDTVNQCALVSSVLGRPGALHDVKSVQLDVFRDAFLTPEMLAEAHEAALKLGATSMGDGYIRIPLASAGVLQAATDRHAFVLSNDIRSDERFTTVPVSLQAAAVGAKPWLDQQRLLDMALCIPDRSKSLCVGPVMDSEGNVFAVLFVANKMSGLDRTASILSEEDSKLHVRSKSIMNAPTGAFSRRDEEIVQGATKALSLAFTDKRVEVSSILCAGEFTPLSTLTDHFRVQLNMVTHVPLQGAKPKPEGKPSKSDKTPTPIVRNKIVGGVCVQILLFHGSSVMAEARMEAISLFSGEGGACTGIWNSFVPLTLKYNNLPFATRIIFNLSYKDGSSIGWAGCNVFTSQQLLLTGSLSLKLWPGKLSADNITHVTNLSNILGEDNATPQLHITLPAFDKTVVRIGHSVTTASRSSRLLEADASGSSADYVAQRASRSEYSSMEKR